MFDLKKLGWMGLIMREDERIDFFVVGVQKGGTTALDNYLRQSKFIQMSDVKEIHFFDDENINWNNQDYKILHNHFDFQEKNILSRGECTPVYMYWPQSIARLQRYSPDARLIVCLRHPALRAHSNWKMETKRGRESLAFDLAISPSGRRRIHESGNNLLTFSYVERGFYSLQITNIFKLFPRSQVIFLRTDELWNSPDRSMKCIHDFLSLPSPNSINSSYIVPIETISFGAMSDDHFVSLTDIYKDDIRQTEELTGLYLSDWLSPDYREPMRLQSA
jgi:hypothetical protein